MRELQMQSEEERLQMRIHSGDPRIMEDIIAYMQPKLYGFGLNMCKNQEDAEETLQEALIAICTHLHQFRAESKLSTWAFRIARNVCFKKHKGKAGEPKTYESFSEQSNLWDEQRNIEQDFITHELWQQVQEGIRLLNPEYREIILLRDVEGMSTADVASVLDISLAATKTKLHRARKQLREYLENAPAPQGCPDIRTIFSQHLEGDLQEEVCISMQGHIASCSYCAAECDKLRQLIKVCSISPLTPPKEIAAKINQEVINYLKL